MKKHIVSIFLFAAWLSVSSACKTHHKMPLWTKLALGKIRIDYGDSVRKYLIGLDWEVMKQHGLESEGHNCYQAIRDKGLQNLNLENKRICGDMAKTTYKLLKRQWNNPPNGLQNLNLENKRICGDMAK